MPEIPDLTMYARNITKRLKGAKVEAAHIYIKEKVNASKKAIEDAIGGKTFKDITRDGKMLYFSFTGGHKLAFHLMLHGKLYIEDDPSGIKARIMSLEFADGRFLVLADWQVRAGAFLDPEIPDAPDVMSDAFTEKYLSEKMDKHARMQIKALITDQKIMRGIGNAYSDEILYESKIHPFSLAGKVPEAKRKALYKAIHKVPAEAEKELVKREPDMINSILRDFLKVHNHKRKESPTGHKIYTHKKGASTTYYTDEQELYE